MVTDSIADLLTRLRNAQRSKHRTVSVPASRVVKGCLEILKGEGLLADYQVIKLEKSKDAGVRGRISKGGVNWLKVYLKYDRLNNPLISEIQRVSRSGRRVYVRADELKKIKGGLGVKIISTSQGLMVDREARRLGVGGEVLAYVF